MEYKTKCLIIGSGVAGCTAGIYTSRANLNPILVCGEIGGQLATTNDVENFPGFENIKGGELTDKMIKQAEKCGTKIVMDFLTEINFSQKPFIAKSSSNTYIADSIIISTGANAKWLNVKGEQEYKGFGVSACAICDGNFFKNKIVAVVGGGNSAITEAIYLSTIAKKVYLIHRNNNFKAEKVLIEKIKKINNIEFKIPYSINEIIGDEDALGKFVKSVNLKNNQTNENENLDLDGVFIAIGHTPNTKLFEGKIKLNERGYIITDPVTKQTNIEGVYACGDVQDELHKQAVVACGSGCICALEVECYLSSQE